jgi:hypothetical protein
MGELDETVSLKEAILARELGKYQAVNSADTVESLKEAIMACSDGGIITGREMQFDAKRMCDNLELYMRDASPVTGLQANTLTRNWGIRQQAIYLKTIKNA